LGLVCWIFLPARSARAGDSRCFLHGTIVPNEDNDEKPSMFDMIRMRFDADNKSKCEKMLFSYCYNNVMLKKYLANRLKGSFKPDMDKKEEYRYHFDKKCRPVSDDDN
jgi:hypothetical protein